MSQPLERLVRQATPHEGAIECVLDRLRKRSREHPKKTWPSHEKGDYMDGTKM